MQSPLGTEQKAIVVEDDTPLRELLKMSFEQAGWVCAAVAEAGQALEKLSTQGADLMVIDIGLPGMNGLELCRVIRASYNPCPVLLVLTARSTDEDIIKGLESGADEYVIKPARPKVILARASALLRRVRPSPSENNTLPKTNTSIKHGDVEIFLSERTVKVAGKTVETTALEFDLLVYFLQSPNRVHSRMTLLEQVWKDTNPAYERNVDGYIMRLRKKLASAGLTPVPIVTVHGVGYRYSPTTTLPGNLEYHDDSIGLLQRDFAGKKQDPRAVQNSITVFDMRCD